MGIDAAAKHLTIAAMVEGEVVKQATIPHTRPAIEAFLARFPGCRIRAAYEAGCFGYWLYDTLTELGVATIVTPPSELERAPGERVKTDRRDSIKLAEQLAAGRLKAVAELSRDSPSSGTAKRYWHSTPASLAGGAARVGHEPTDQGFGCHLYAEPPRCRRRGRRERGRADSDPR